MKCIQCWHETFRCFLSSMFQYAGMENRGKLSSDLDVTRCFLWNCWLMIQRTKSEFRLTIYVKISECLFFCKQGVRGSTGERGRIGSPGAVVSVLFLTRSLFSLFVLLVESLIHPMADQTFVLGGQSTYLIDFSNYWLYICLPIKWDPCQHIVIFVIVICFKLKLNLILTASVM